MTATDLAKAILTNPSIQTQAALLAILIFNPPNEQTTDPTSEAAAE